MRDLISSEKAIITLIAPCLEVLGFGQYHFWAFPEDLIDLCADSQCEWAGEELFIG